MAARERRARIVGARALSPSVQSLLLEIEAEVSVGPDPDREAELGTGAPPRFTFRAGQWMHLHVPTEIGIQKRAYSIASAPRERPIELAVTLVEQGVVSPVLCGLSPGAELGCDGPYGFFVREREASEAPALFVGTGTGLSPLRSMLAELLADGDHPPFTLLFGVRSQADILWREQLESWAARDPRFKLAVTLSRPDLGWTGRTGYVQRHVAELARELGAPHVFICGLQGMVGEVRALCKAELGYDRKRVHSERYD